MSQESRTYIVGAVGFGGLALALTLFGHRVGYRAGFEQGSDSLRATVEPGKVPCIPQYGLHYVSAGETPQDIADLYGVDVWQMLAVNNLLESNGEFDPTRLQAGRCLRVDSVVFAEPTPTSFEVVP